MSDNLQQQELDQIADDVRSNLTKSVEHIIRAGQALQRGRDMHRSDNAFHDWCMKEFPDLNSKMRERIMQVGRRFGTTFMSHHLPITVLYELAAPSLPEEKAHEFLEQNPNPSVKDVKEFKQKLKEPVSKKPSDVPYDVREAMFSILGNAASYMDRCPISDEEAAKILVDIATEDVNTVKQDVSRLLRLKRLLDLAAPDLNQFPKGKLKLV